MLGRTVVFAEPKLEVPLKQHEKKSQRPGIEGQMPMGRRKCGPFSFLERRGTCVRFGLIISGDEHATKCGQC